MDKRNLNGPDFKYRVMWRRVVGSGPDWHEKYTTAPPFIVNHVHNFSAFEMKVQAVNKKGPGPEPDPVIGYSGEDGKKKGKVKRLLLTGMYINSVLGHVSQFRWRLR